MSHVVLCLMMMLFHLSTNSCIYHPADTKNTCLERKIPCSIPHCERCQRDTCLECKEGMFLHYEKGECMPCVSGCGRCFDSTLGSCWIAASGYTFTSKNELEKCPGDCISCGLDVQDPTRLVCSICPSGYRITSVNGSHSSGVVCARCEVRNCSECQKSTDTCDRCDFGFDMEGDYECIPKKEKCEKYNYQGKCVDCPAGQLWSTTAGGCVYCPKECSNCEFPGKCSSCRPGFTFDQKSESCYECMVEGCKSCLDSPKICDTCTAGKYFDLKEMKCKACHKSCATCTGPLDSDCSHCTARKKYQKFTYTRMDSQILKASIQSFRNKFPQVMSYSFYMDINFHPTYDNYCLDTCRDEEEKELEGRVNEVYPPDNPEHCPTFDMIHPLMYNKFGGPYQDTVPTDEDKMKDMKERRKNDKESYKRQHEDLVNRENEMESEEGSQEMEIESYKSPRDREYEDGVVYGSSSSSDLR